MASSTLHVHAAVQNGVAGQLAVQSLLNKAAGPTFAREVSIDLQPEDLASVRFAFSPLWECIAAFRAWKMVQTHTLLLPWKARVTEGLRRTDWSLLADLALVQRGSIPDFLCPPPTVAMPTLGDELCTLKRTPDEVIRSEVRIACRDSVPPSLHQAMQAPRVFAAKVAVLIEHFWHEAIAPYWALLRARLEGEMLYRARALAIGGFEQLFTGLHKDVSFRDGHLVVRTASHWDGRERKQGLLLLPSIFCWPEVHLTVRPPWRTAITYPSRGIADLWDDAPSKECTGLQQLVGPSCARVIANLQVPRTTLEMSAAIGLSPAATSEQITKLRTAGILERIRVGRRVFYSLNQKGMLLFSTFNA